MNVAVYTDLDALPPEVEQALRFSAGRRLQWSLEWFRCLAEHGIDITHTPRLYVATDDNGVAAALYCAARHRELHSLTSFYTNGYGPVCVGEQPAAALGDIATFIAGERPRWQRVELRYLNTGDPALGQLLTAFDHKPFEARQFFQYGNWTLPMDGSNFADYYATLPSRLRNTLGRKARKIAREHELVLTLFPAESEDIEVGIAHYQTVYNSSWKKPEPFPEFIPALIRTCHRLGVLRLGVATVDGEAAAAQLWIVSAGRALIYKLAYDERFAKLSVGSLLSLRLFEQAIDEDGVDLIDYGVGDEPYKRDWMTERSEAVGIEAANLATLRGRIANLRTRFGRGGG